MLVLEPPVSQRPTHRVRGGRAWSTSSCPAQRQLNGHATRTAALQVKLLQEHSTLYIFLRCLGGNRFVFPCFVSPLPHKRNCGVRRTRPCAMVTFSILRIHRSRWPAPVHSYYTRSRPPELSRSMRDPSSEHAEADLQLFHASMSSIVVCGSCAMPRCTPGSPITGRNNTTPVDHPALAAEAIGFSCSINPEGGGGGGGKFVFPNPRHYPGHAFIRGFRTGDGLGISSLTSPSIPFRA